MLENISILDECFFLIHQRILKKYPTFIINQHIVNKSDRSPNDDNVTVMTGVI